MLKIENVEIHGWEPAIRGMRNPKNSWAKSDSGLGCRSEQEGTFFCHECTSGCWNPSYVLGENDLHLAETLASAGTDHRKFMRMITVYLDVTAPLYWWKEYDTYKVGTVANSCSTMHKIAEKEFTLEDFSHEHLFHQTSVQHTGKDMIPYALTPSDGLMKALCQFIRIMVADDPAPAQQLTTSDGR